MIWLKFNEGKSFLNFRFSVNTATVRDKLIISAANFSSGFLQFYIKFTRLNPPFCFNSAAPVYL